MKENKYKYAHVFTVDSGLYNRTVQQLICEIQNKDEHIFIYMHSLSFSLVKDRNLGATLLEEVPCTVEILRKALGLAQIVVIHNMGFPNAEIMKLSDSEASRLVWSVWGPDLYTNRELVRKRSCLYEFARFCWHLLKFRHIRIIRKNSLVWKQIAFAEAAEAKINKFRAICAGFEGDIEEIRRRFPDVPVHQALYPGECSLEKIAEWKNKLHKNDEPHKRPRVLVGHCAFLHLQHEKWLKKLSEQKNMTGGGYRCVPSADLRKQTICGQNRAYGKRIVR